MNLQVERRLRALLALFNTSVVGPASATDNAVARFDSTTGKLVQNSAFIVDDSGHVSSFGGQIKFPATQAESADPNTLDDYEEGTWTVTVAGDGVAGTQTYSTQSGRYTKNGRQCNLEFTVVMTAKDAATAGSVYLVGSPFTAGALGGGYIHRIGNVNLSAGYSQFSIYMGGTSSLYIMQSGDNIGHSFTASADISATTDISGGASFSV